MLTDAEAILADVPRVSAEVGRTFRRIIVMGRSLGSASAIHLAATQREQVAALVLDSPYADLPRLIARLGGPVIKPEAVQGVEDNIDKMRKSNVPLLILHGNEDRIISVSESDTLVEACPSDNKRLFRVPRAGHNTLLQMAGEAYWSEVQGIVKRVAG